MHIHVATPAAPGSRLGNGVSASRWSKMLAQLGHTVTTSDGWSGEACDLLVALHARRSHAAIVAFCRERPAAPVVLVLTGTDLYRDLPADPRARASLALADRVVALHSRAPAVLEPAARAKLRVIEQSAVVTVPRQPTASCFQVVVLSHLRPVKDCLRPALAARRMPSTSRLEVRHGGIALDPEVAAAARREMAENQRYRWLGPLDEQAAASLLAESHLLALPSRLEGGANVLCEALALGVPVVASAVDGNIGLLGDAYAGYHPACDTEALAALLDRAERDGGFYAGLERQVAARRYLVAPEREQRLWADLLAEL